MSEIFFSVFYQEIIKPSSRSTNQEEGALTAMDEDYQALTAKEESDLETLMSDTQTAISNAENFAEHLSKQLSVLDGVRFLRTCYRGIFDDNSRIILTSP